MASKRTRGSAASKLLKDMPDDEQMPPEDAGAPSDAPPVADDASAPPPAGGLEGMAESSEGLPPGSPEEAAPAPDDGSGDSGMDLDAALAGVESALQGMPEDAAREIRTHLEAIKDIASQAGGTSSQPSAPESEPPSDIPSPDSGMPGTAPGMEEKV